MTDQMKPCPFCGGEGGLAEEVYYYPGPPLDRWFPVCAGGGSTEECPMMNPSNDDEQGGVSVSYATKQEAIDAWNARPREDVLLTRIAELEKAGQDLYVCIKFGADPLLKDTAMRKWDVVMGVEE